jgi:F-type H+-transporting ATPase subunit gamma
MYSRISSACPGNSRPVVKQLPPIPAASKGEKPGGARSLWTGHIRTVPRTSVGAAAENVNVQIHQRVLLETSTSEHAARMAAMDNATRNCNDMIDNLTLVYNKARQAAITAELMDIVGGAEALKR